MAPYGPFRAGDGKTVFLGIQNEREFARFCAQVIDQPGLTGDARFATSSARNENRGEMNALIEAAFADKTAAQIVARLEEAGIANARLNTMQEFWDHPQLEARNRWREVGSPVGTLDALMPPLNIAGVEPDIGPVPRVGEHTRAVLGELGYDASSIDRLSAEGAV
jgi:itaconate CoA-transferase